MDTRKVEMLAESWVAEAQQLARERKPRQASASASPGN